MNLRILFPGGFSHFNIGHYLVPKACEVYHVTMWLSSTTVVCLERTFVSECFVLLLMESVEEAVTHSLTVDVPPLHLC